MTEPLTLRSERIEVRCLPARGATIDSLRDRASGAEALWHWERTEPARCRRELGPGGALSATSFLDVFVGGWFTMFPAAGLPDPDDPLSLMHGELVRLPWEVLHADERLARLRVETVRAPFAVDRTLAVEGGELRVVDRVRNVGAEPAPYAFGHHPCLARETFAGGVVELEVERAEVPDPPYDPPASRLAVGAVDWPRGRLLSGEPTDLSLVPREPDGGADHVCLRVGRGRARVTAPAIERALVLEWELADLPELLLWRNLRGRGGYPFWGAADTLAIECSTVPGRTLMDARAAAAIRSLAPGETFETTMSARWEAAATPR